MLFFKISVYYVNLTWDWTYGRIVKLWKNCPRNSGA